MYEEAEECIRLGKDLPEVIEKQMERYRKEGYKADNGLVVTNVLVRKHTDKNVIKLMNLWWEEIERNSKRDQLSFNYACWKLGINYDVSELKCWRSPYWMNPGIHTKVIREVEEELINHIQYSAYKEYQLSEKQKYIALKEQELEEAHTLIGWKEQELKDAHTLIKWKEQELEDANTQITWKEQTLKDVYLLLEQKQQELNLILNSTSWKYTKIFRDLKRILLR